MPKVNIPNVGIVNFPDGMSPEEIQAHAAKLAQPGAPVAPSDLSGPSGNSADFGSIGGGPMNTLRAVAGVVPVIGTFVNKATSGANTYDTLGLDPVTRKPVPAAYMRGMADVATALLPLAGSTLTAGARPLVKMAGAAISGGLPEFGRIAADYMEGKTVTPLEASARVGAAGTVNAALEGGFSKAAQIIALKRYANQPEGALKAALDDGYNQVIKQVAANPQMSGPEALQLAAKTHNDIGSQMFEDLRAAGGDKPVVDFSKVAEVVQKMDKSLAASKPMQTSGDYMRLRNYLTAGNGGPSDFLSAMTPAQRKQWAGTSGSAVFGNPTHDFTMDQAIERLRTINAATQSNDPQVAQLAKRIYPEAQDAVMKGAEAIGPDTAQLAKTAYQFYGEGKELFGQKVIRAMIEATPDKAAGAAINGGRDAAMLTQKALAYVDPNIRQQFKRNVIQEVVSPGGVSDPQGVLKRLDATKPALDVLMDTPTDQAAMRQLREIATVSDQIQKVDPALNALAQGAYVGVISRHLGLKGYIAKQFADQALVRTIYNGEASSAYVQGLRKLAAGDTGTALLNIARAADATFKGFDAARGALANKKGIEAEVGPESQ